MTVLGEVDASKTSRVFDWSEPTSMADWACDLGGNSFVREAPDGFQVPSVIVQTRRSPCIPPTAAAALEAQDNRVGSVAPGAPLTCLTVYGGAAEIT